MEKGQTSFELLFLALVVLSVSAFITTMYLQTNENTTILAVTKTELLTQLNKSNSNNLIESINIEKNQLINNQTIIIKILSTNPTELKTIINSNYINDLNLMIKEKFRINNQEINLTIQQI